VNGAYCAQGLIEKIFLMLQFFLFNRRFVKCKQKILFALLTVDLVIIHIFFMEITKMSQYSANNVYILQVVFYYYRSLFLVSVTKRAWLIILS
jgi:hypothetical protein